jgi:hypothetical protein
MKIKELRKPKKVNGTKNNKPKKMLSQSLT